MDKLTATGRTVDLLVTDVTMPGMDGREVAQRVSRLFPSAGVLYISGYTENAIVEFLQKPLDATTLLGKVRSILDRPKPISSSP